MAGIVFILCGLTSLACAVLLWRSYLRGRVRLVFWASLCFAGFAVENAALYGDRIVFPHIELSSYRLGIGFASIALFVYGLVWDSSD